LGPQQAVRIERALQRDRKIESHVLLAQLPVDARSGAGDWTMFGTARRRSSINFPPPLSLPLHLGKVAMLKGHHTTLPPSTPVWIEPAAAPSGEELD
jgi:hypothetical protein